MFVFAIRVDSFDFQETVGHADVYGFTLNEMASKAGYDLADWFD